MMHRLLFLFFMLGINLFTLAQNSQNPFDLSSSTPEETETIHPTASTEIVDDQVTNQNPFDLGNNATESNIGEVEIPTDDGNPFDLGTSSGSSPDQPVVIPPTTTKDTPNQKTDEQAVAPSSDGWILGLTLFILAIATFIFIFFRSLYSKIYKAILNDNQLSLLYRERTGGTIGSFIIAYILFFLSAGLFIYLTLLHFNQIPAGTPLKDFGTITASLACLFIAKHLVLALSGYVFPINKETRLYSFTVMIFSIILGILLPFADLILAYSTESNKTIIIYFMGVITVLMYLLRSLRGIFIANRFIFNFSFHFLLYLCAVEIVPALILYKIIFDY